MTQNNDLSTTTYTTKGHYSLRVMLFDIVVSAVASTLSVLLMRASFGTFIDFQHYAQLWPLAAIAATGVAVYLAGCHHIIARYTSLRSIGRYFVATLIKEAIMITLLMTDVLYFGNIYQELGLVVSDFTATISFIVLARVVIAELNASSANNVGRNVNRLPVMVFGVPDKAVAVITRLAQSSNYLVVGVLSNSPADNGQIINSTRTYSFQDADDLKRLKREIGFEGVIVATSNMEAIHTSGLVDMCLESSLHVLMAPPVEEITYGGAYTQTVISHLNTKDEFIPDGMSAFSRNTKRIIDCTLSGILLIIFSPLFLICYIAVKCEDGGPAIFSQERLGRFGRSFNIYKFRSMRMDAESAGPALFSGDDDPRLTKVGKFLRLHHLDELPQLWNVFTGDMAFIGYRPEREFYIKQIAAADPRYAFLYQIRPGVTSYATLKNGYTDTLEKMLRRLEYDLYYLRHRSLWFDCSILFQTFMNIAFGKKF